MRFELKEFQERAAKLLLEEIHDARSNLVRRSRPQAIVLSSPTGSGKTITMAAVIERTLTGTPEELGANPNATILWFSDSPELNAQSRDKIAYACDELSERRLVMIDTEFDREMLEPGTVYFLNTQKLAKSSLLVRKGDNRTWTIWETIRNTIERAPEDLYMIIDEAHRGMTTTADIAAAQTIVQKFIVGDADIPPVPLILGMSATPQRFEQLIGATNRTSRIIAIDPADVRESGLLKDRIILFHPDEDQTSDHSLLREAVRSWRRFSERWASYCTTQNEPEIVRPLLVVQVEDGAGNRITKTDLNRVVETLRDAYPEIGPRGLVHCFDEDRVLEAGGFAIRKVDPSKLQNDPEAEVVLFKRALTTGWDCPRAEVIMSFRRAVDATMIAQLVGRMVRSPLARRIEGDDGLNSVALYLPYYDREALDRITRTLSAPDPEAQMSMSVEEGDEGVDYPRAPNAERFVALIESLPSYRIARAARLSEAKRLLRLGFFLTSRDRLDEAAQDEALEGLLAVLEAERNRLREEDDFAARVMDTGEIEVREVVYDVRTQSAESERTIHIPASEDNINDLFLRMARKIAPGEALHTAFWKRNHRPDEPLRARIEFIVVAQNTDAVAALEERAAELFDAIYERNKGKIAALGERAREAYANLQARAKDPRSFPIVLPRVIHERRGSGPWPRHLYRNADGLFEADLNAWETAVLETELAKPEVVAWLRNQERKPWAICIPYEDGGYYRPFYPDFVFVREAAGGLVVDLIEPHDIGRDDSWKKAKGLARYALNHGHSFGRLLFGTVVRDRLLALDANDRRDRDLLLRLSSNEELRNLLLSRQ